MAENKKQKLFEDFPPVATETWEEKINADLKGADYEKKLVWRTNEGFNVSPYYRREHLKGLEFLESNPGEFPYVRSTKKHNNDWEIRQDIRVDDVKQANEKALFVLDRGITSLGFSLPDNKKLDSEDFSALLKSIFFECIHLNFISGNQAPRLLDLLIAETKSKKVDKNRVLGSIDFDPLGALTVTGNTYTHVEDDFQQAASLIEKAEHEIPNYRVLAVHASHFSNAGASIVQELGLGLAMAVEYLNQLTEKGLGIDTISKHLQFIFGVGSNYFMEIAKLRAARLLWAHIIKSYDPASDDSAKMYIHSVTSDWNKTIYDPYVNMLRATTESMSAVMGGTNSLYVKPFDAPFRKVSKFSGRIARNTQIMLKEEAYLDKVVDPGAGSYYIENLTCSIADQAWNVFLQIEEQGGYVEAFKSGFIQTLIAETVAKRSKNIATRREVFVGTNQYPNGDELISKEVDPETAFPVDRKADNAIAEPLKFYRGTMQFEQLRLATEQHSHRPKVFMLTMGSLAWRKARAGFASGFFACAGYEIIDNLGFNTVDEGVQAAFDAKADIVVVCSSDDEYAGIVPAVKEKLDDKAILVVAGAPPSMDELKAKGVEHFVHVKTNVLETLQKFNTLLGIAK
ncbi:MAG: methylmalonyl-CoA mutase family protein [Bacteroidota bacterium]